MEQTNNTNAVSLVDILKMFRGKLVPLVCVTLAAAILFAGFILVKSLFFSDYGAQITLYLSHTDASHELLTVLQSESFAEKILLDENGLPPKDQCNPEDYAAALSAVEIYNNALDTKADLFKELNLYPFSLAVIENTYKNLENDYKEIYDLLEIYKSVRSDQIASTENHAKMILEYENKLAIISAEKTKYQKEVYEPAIEKKLQLQQKFAEASELVKTARDDANKLVEKVVAPWRADKEVHNDIRLVANSLSLEYAKREVIDGKDTIEAENGLFLIINVAVDGSKEDANEIIEGIKALAPDFIRKNLERLTGSVETDCTLISTLSDAQNLSSGSMLTNAIIFAVLGGILGFVAFCAVIICKNLLSNAPTVNTSEAPVDETEDIYAEK